jgi:hypothetical protein
MQSGWHSQYSNWGTGWTTRNSIHEKQIFSLLPKRPDLVWGPRSLLLNGHRSALQGIKQPGREVDIFSPSFAEINNG